jgi:Tol biopolymer transport system component
MNIAKFMLILVILGTAGCSHGGKKVEPGKGERHFKSLRQLTFEGTNAEAYFSPDGKKLIFQGRRGDGDCDQIYSMNLDGSGRKLLSREGGRATCSFFLDGERVLFSSTHESGRACPKERDRSKGYVWEIFKSFDIYSARPDGTDLNPLTRTDGYDAEATVCGGRVVFTSARQLDSLHIYVMNADGSGVERLTHRAGYNGGPFFSPDCSRIVYRAYHPEKKAELKRFKAAVRQGYIPPGPLEVYAMNADGGDKRQLTAMGKASFAPSFFPDGERVIFSSNLGQDGPGRVFHLWAIDGTNTLQTEGERITTEGTFNGFPMFSPDGKHLVFASNRNSANSHELQVFLAEWQD